MSKQTLDWRCRKLPFAVGDCVKTPRSVDRIEAIGSFCPTAYTHAINMKMAVVYKVKGQYWFGWQLQKQKVKAQ